MPRFAVWILLGLAACAVCDGSREGDLNSGDMQGWRLASGKTPSRAEYRAMVAACQDAAVQHEAAATIDSCLAGLGPKRAE
jgi:hypothetical protein